jgi:hypothetical protein
MLDFIDEPLNQVSVAVNASYGMACDRDRLGGITASAPRSAIQARNRLESNPISARSFSKEKPHQVFSLQYVVDLACGDDEADRIAECIHAHIDLRTQAPSRERPIASSSVPPFCLAAC